MSMPALSSWTVEMVRALPDDGNRYEVVGGALLVTPSPSLPHQNAAFQLARLLADHADATASGQVVIAPADVVYDARTMVEPDVFVLPLVDGRWARTVEEAGAPLLVIEVLSPTTARRDRTVKRALYQRHGVPEYWIVDTERRVIERWRPRDVVPEILATSIAWRIGASGSALVIDLPAFFRKVCGD